MIEKITPDDLGKLVHIHDNRRIVTHYTPRWSYGEYGRVIRLNDRTLTVSLIGRYEGEKIRVDYADVSLAEKPG